MTDSPYRHQQWRNLRPVIYERDGGICQLCHKPVSIDQYDVDHIIPWQEGGSWYDPGNLRLACWKCNRGRGGQRMQLAAKINRQKPAAPSRHW